MVKKVIGFIVLAVAATVVLSSFTVVEAGERGVALTWGAFDGQVYEPGLHWLTPFAQSVVKMDVRTALLPQNAEAYTSDLQNVTIASAVNYNVDPKMVGVVYQKYGLDYAAKIFPPALASVVKQTVAKYSSEEMLSKRGEVQSNVEAAFRASIPPEFTLTKYSLIDEAFSDAYEKAIEAKQVAHQNAEKAKNELTQAQVDADARIAKARGEAEAIKISAEAINSQGGADYVQLQAIAKWNGVLPAQFVPGSAVPFLTLGEKNEAKK